MFKDCFLKYFEVYDMTIKLNRDGRTTLKSSKISLNS